ncbi:hypothetical protein G9X67_34890 [Rhizobium sp. WYCCWR 11152]|uniref:hypothetical protein n=1 Tax=Rhizobium sp. WYCCWR 11152 TaxID=2692316 RepID=UPI00149290AD|nr:hypothetical protein [Rhizobium sp. WYCCWR 11152]NNU70441.1 hypothetical protein [Rhizobium sp. WYCCWR 11152]
MANSRLCSIPECYKPRYGNGCYCEPHYRRLLKHGDPLGGGTSKGELLRWIHEVALHHVGDECLIWPFGKGGRGYGNLWIDGKMVNAHRYLCQIAHGEPPTPDHEAAHSCGKGHEGCISQEHLSWKTHSENMADKLIHGTHRRGERNAGAKLTEADVLEIRAMKGVETLRKTAERFGVSQEAISAIHRGKKWAWLQAAEQEKAE